MSQPDDVEDLVDVDEIAVARALLGEPVRLNMAERRTAVAAAWEKRWSDVFTAHVLGIADRTVIRIRQELGLPAHAHADLVKARGAA